MKKAILKLNGKYYEVELTEQEVNEITKEDKPYINRGNSFWYINRDGEIEPDKYLTDVDVDEIPPNESKNRKNLERALAYIKIKNWADHYNDQESDKWFIVIHELIYCVGLHKNKPSAYIFFSSEELARKASDLFKEDFKLLYSQD